MSLKYISELFALASIVVQKELEVVWNIHVHVRTATSVTLYTPKQKGSLALCQLTTCCNFYKSTVTGYRILVCHKVSWNHSLHWLHIIMLSSENDACPMVGGSDNKPHRFPA